MRRERTGRRGGFDTTPWLVGLVVDAGCELKGSNTTAGRRTCSGCSCTPRIPMGLRSNGFCACVSLLNAEGAPAARLRCDSVTPLCVSSTRGDANWKWSMPALWPEVAAIKEGENWKSSLLVSVRDPALRAPPPRPDNVDNDAVEDDLL